MKSAKPGNNFKNILVVDDDPITLTFTARALTSAGFTTVLAANGEKVLSWLATNCFDAVVSDVIMRRMTGFELLENVQVRFPGLPVILLTVSKREGMCEAAIVCWAATLFGKPVCREELVSVLTLALDAGIWVEADNCSSEDKIG